MAKQKGKYEVRKLLFSWMRRSETWKRAEMIREIVDEESIIRFLSGTTCAECDAEVANVTTANTQKAVRRAMRRLGR